jgi:hypothetical protein
MIKARIYIALFALISLIPLIQLATHLLPDAPLNEKRRPLPAPEWRKSRDLQNYLMGWQDWFNDRYPGRNFLIRLKTQIDYSLFGYSDKIYVGKEGWLFYRSVLDEGKPAINAYNTEQISALIGEFKKLNGWLRDRGVTLVIMDNQLKDEFYADKLPASAPRRPQHPGYYEIRRRLREDVGALYIDPTEILMKLKASRPVFHKTDFHWNDPAAFEVARALVDRLALASGRPSAGWKFELKIETRPNSGGEAAFMPLFSPASEKSLFVKKTWTDEGGAYALGGEPFEYVYRRYKPSADYLPVSVILGDSFSDGMQRSGLSEHFNELYRIRMYHCSLGDALRSMPKGTRIFILQFIEQSVNFFSIPVDFASLSSVQPNGS